MIISEGGDRTVDLWAVLMRFPACLEHLQRLSVVTTAYSTAYYIGLLASVAPTLRHFELAAGQTGPYIPLITIPYMPHVKTVELPIVIEGGYTVTYPSRLNSLLAEVAASVPQPDVQRDLSCRHNGAVALPAPATLPLHTRGAEAQRETDNEASQDCGWYLQLVSSGFDIAPYQLSSIVIYVAAGGINCGIRGMLGEDSPRPLLFAGAGLFRWRGAFSR
ncbi:hypothetical protein C8J57DRAFT_1465032 [Mycena rebaudengoi]|nr:hypothetical protein C8J57DRAFT_1465032 [Mycena rebaudengoi]